VEHLQEPLGIALDQDSPEVVEYLLSRMDAKA